MHGFQLKLAPRTLWTDLTRDLVAAGAARSGLSVDRFADLLILTEQVASDLLEHGSGEAVTMSMTASEAGVEVTFETTGAEPSPLTRLALERLADSHWYQVDPDNATTGFVFSG